MRYAELHCHSAFSFLDGASLPDELVATALSLGYEALALTDHNSVSGSMEFAVAARGLGLRAIHGAEIDLAADGPHGRHHLTLLVADARGWSNLCRIITAGHAHTRDGRPGAPVGEPSVGLETVLAHSEGLVCLSGCATHGVEDEPTLRTLRDAFGPERLRIELQRPFLRHDRARNRRREQLARRLGLRCVATGDVHAHARTRAPLQDAFVAIRVHATLDASEPLRRGNFSHVLVSPEAMAARFPEHPEAVAESVRLAESLRFDLGHDLGYRYPGAEDVTAMRRLSALCESLMEVRYGDGDARLRARARERLEQELTIISRLDLPGFFLLHHEMLELAHEVAIEVRGPDEARSLLPPGRGRGSSVSSIVCYLTGLSHVDPIANELLIGRFLHEELTSLPDIDLDFPRDIRERLIPRIHERFGRDRSALVAAFPTYRARGAIREIGKALGLPQGEIERVARGSEGWSARDVARDIESAFGVDLGEEFATAREMEWASDPRDPHDPPPPDVDPRRDVGRERAGTGSPGALRRGTTEPEAPRRGATERWRWLARLAAEAHGLPRHLSQHSGGMVVATRPLIDCCPIVPAAMEGRQIVQWDKDSCADAGFLKIDLLGLGMLSAVERSVALIARTRGVRVDLSRIDYDDPKTYALIQSAETTGVFQIESRAQMASLHRTRPQNLRDITIQVAIVRPGPIQGGAVNPYIQRRQRLRADPSYQVPYEHPSLEGPLGDTLGTIIFQDQVLEVSMAFAGFSVSEAEGLRRAMSRKRSEAAIEAYHARFVEGAQRTHGVEEGLAERVFEMVRGFSGFGFPKAHGAAFGLLAYQSTWLRVHYGPEFLCGLLSEQPMGFYPPDALVHEAQRRGVVVLPPDVNESGVECVVEPDPDRPGEPRIRIGLGYVRGVRRQELEELVAARERGGRFRSLADLASRAGSGAPALALLAWSGACDRLALEEERSGDGNGETSPELEHARASFARRTALWQLGVMTPGRRVPGGTQLALPLDLPAPPPLAPLSAWQRMLADYGATGLTTGTHPLGLLRPRLGPSVVSSRDLRRLDHRSQVRIGGLVVARQRPGTASGVVFVLLEDEFGTVNLVIPPAVYERHRLVVRTEPLMLVEGTLERLAAAGGAINVLVDTVGSIDAPDRIRAEIKDFSLLDEGVRRGLEEQRAASGLRVVGEDGVEREPAVAGGRGAWVGVAAPAAALGADGFDGGEAEDFRAVAPPVMSFAQGRRR
ncbi:MAG TPA: DNA polymerase III subunit alpha [Solirubrobacteraceae bacterium]|nr:DNA polymerase III subunit alpha [Solirubrobacteraceae bacterium]